MPFRACIVSFADKHGVKRSVDVDAETAYEAAALALKAFEQRRYLKGPNRHATFEIEINKPARLLIEVKVSSVLRWLYERTPKNDAEAERVKRLRGLLADDRH
jgi:hypothetical protein